MLPHIITVHFVSKVSTCAVTVFLCTVLRCFKVSITSVDVFQALVQVALALRKYTVFNIKYLCMCVVQMEKTANRTNDEDEEDEDDEDWDEADDDGKIYKNPRNSPSADCPRDEEQATLLVNIYD